MRALALAALLFVAGCESAADIQAQREIACQAPRAPANEPRIPGAWRDEFDIQHDVTRTFADDARRVVINDNFRTIVEGAESEWLGPYGLSLGLSAAELARVNRGAFEVFWSFEHGFVLVSSWRNGRMSPLKTCDMFRVYLTPRNPAALASLKGGGGYGSTRAEIRAADLYVSRIDFGYIPTE